MRTLLPQRMKNFKPPQNQNKEREERKRRKKKEERRKKKDRNTKKRCQGRERGVFNGCGEIEQDLVWGKERGVASSFISTKQSKKRRLGAKRACGHGRLKRRKRERINLLILQKIRKKRNSKKEKRKNKPSSSLQNDFQNSIEFFSKSEIISVPNESITTPEGSFR